MGLSERLEAFVDSVPQQTEPELAGRLTRMVGLTLECVGCPMEVGDRCLIRSEDRPTVEAEVVGFEQERVYLMPLSAISGLRPGALVVPLASASRVPVGEGLLGRVINGSGEPLDGRGALESTHSVPFSSPVINPLNRAPIRQRMDVGIRSINALNTVGQGQRLGLFAGSGVGKSVLMGMMTRFTDADITVVGLIGERGREVKEFIEEILGEEGLSRSVVVAAPADDSPLMRLRAAMLTTRIAEYFRDRGKKVLLLMDSLTRYAQAQREIALAIGEPPATKGYPPSVFARIPQLVERAGNGEKEGGSITAFYTVLTEGDDQQDPIADAARAILDGHLVLSRRLAEEGHYPAIDIEGSVSRVMPHLVSEDHLRQAQRFKQLYSRYQQARDLISVGAYQKGSDPETDTAIDKMPAMRQFLQQGLNESASYKVATQRLAELMDDGSPGAARQGAETAGDSGRAERG